MFTPPSAAARKVTQDEMKYALSVLYIYPADLSAAHVQVAYRARVREAHPDAGGDAAAAPDRLKELRAARDTLLAWLESAPKADCKECRGTGYVFGRLVVKPCSRCG